MTTNPAPAEANAPDHPSDLAAWVLRHRRDRPHDVAVSTTTREWTWRALADAVDRRCEASDLKALQPSQAFGWLGYNSVAMLVTLLACARLGLRFVPFNWRLTESELHNLASHAQLAAWHVDERLASLVPRWSSISPHATGAPAGTGSRRVEHSHRLDQDLLLVYTSGTTGDPKGALHTQAAMLANIAAAIDSQGLDAKTRCLAVLPMFHMGGLCIQLLPTLAAGGVVRLHERFDATSWLNDVAHWRPTTSLMVPATMQAVIGHAQWPQTDLSSLDSISAGSSIVPRQLIDAFHARGVAVTQVYGATETGPVTLVLRREDAFAHAGTVGREALGVQVKLVQGELWVRAPNLARAYHRREADDTWVDGWFRTGDLATLDEAGCYTIIGRTKELIISGGENILPTEIESLALLDSHVAQACAVGIAHPRWGEVPCLVLVAKPGCTIDLDALRTRFRDHLARFKHPKHVVVMDALPTTALGKVARGALKTMLNDELAWGHSASAAADGSTMQP